MKFHDQFINFDLAKEFKNLGIHQNSHFFWAQYKCGNAPKHEKDIVHRYLVTHHDLDDLYDSDGIEDFEYYAAFSVAELGVLLNKMVITYRSAKDYWECAYDPKGICLTAKTEADARAKMFLYLLENNFLSEEQNEI